MSDTPTARMFAAERAQAYDDRVRTAIPGYEALHSLTCAAIAEATGGRGRVLVAGAGTGTECVALGRAIPDIAVVGVDPAADMLTLAAHKVAAAGLEERIRLQAGSVADLPVAAPFDAATLLLVLHFLPDDRAKAGLLADLALRLKPGATLVLADLFGPAWDEPGQARLRAIWRRLQLDGGIDAEDVAKGFSRVDRDIHPRTESQLAELLAAAGFGPPQPFFRALCFGGWVVRRR